MRNLLRLIALSLLLVSLPCGIEVAASEPVRHSPTVTLTKPRTDPDAIRVVSYNVRIFCGMDLPNAGRVVESDSLSRGRLIKLLRWMDADFIALQEVDYLTERSGWDDQVGRLAEGTGLHGTFVDAIDRSKGKYGIGLLSREKPVSVKRIQLPGSEELRVMMVAEFKDCYVINTHFSLVESDRAKSVEILSKECEGLYKPVIVCGDFNEAWEGANIKELSGRLTLLTDPLPSYPADNPKSCLDYVWGLGISEDAVCRKVLLDEPKASDHRPWIVDVKL